jgi:hypothetical protein
MGKNGCRTLAHIRGLVSTKIAAVVFRSGSPAERLLLSGGGFTGCQTVVSLGSAGSSI